jgi:general secretion pathway protein F
MPAFEYQALDANGHTQTGVLQADTPRAARGSLRERGLSPLSVSAVREGGSRSPGGFGRGLGSAQLALFARQLATLVGSGLPIDESLAALAEGSEGRMRSLVVALRARVMEGNALAAALAEHPQAFPALFRTSIAAGESAGRLDQVLRRLADYAESRDALRQRVLLALTYPLLLTVVALAVVTALMVYVVPQVTGVFAQFGQTLPWATRVLITISDTVRDYGLWMLLAAALLSLTAFLALRQPAMRERLQLVLLRLPLLGKLLRAVDTSRFARTLALLTASAVPLLEAIGIAAQVVQILPLRRALAQVALRVREGRGFARALAESKQFPPIAVRLIQSGETSGRLEAMLSEAADHQERELDAALGVSMAALGPAVILLIGGMVLFIVLAILLPIFDLNSLIK